MGNRFYPDTVLPYPCEPTRDRFEIRKTADGRGEAVTSLVHFNPGETVFVFSGVVIPELTLFSLQLSETEHVHDPFFMGKILHSCAPNTRVVMVERRFIATDFIMPGDCVTMDYESTEDRLFRGFECHCGSSACKGFIRGAKVSSDDETMPIYKEDMDQIIAATQRATHQLISGKL